ncbi:sigma-70 family RNA polymerase sigma factor [Cohnella sp. CFH 77786]|uniref:RNA polymerase sigma factor SigJ n=1 Tax=Cohnella sp. CFH 77786 TaxID=2662265 RepID=UPI001C608107|nr:RNA polymerase sigma factor SigJ [Cohnella sp. CFH 77786]MBW5447467.1 sigma-70 family RNA polymerase sigma factor [Cohnella sp. CFH 77786]
MNAERETVPERPDLTEWYLAHRRYLLSVAYRMLGTCADAEDAVHDVFLHLQDRDASAIREPRPYLTKMVVRRCLDILKSARKKRETYVGPWLPEPDVRPADEEPVSGMLLEETVSYALMVVMERLTPGERAVFLLHEAFGYGYGETAAALGKTEAACRQLMSRIRRKLDGEWPEPVPKQQARELVLRFLEAAASGRMESLVMLLREDIAVVTDGGGRVSAALRPLLGIERAAAFVLGLAAKYGKSDIEVVPVLVNGEMGLGFREQGAWTTVLAFEWRDGKLRRMFIVRNPDKLERLVRAEDRPWG